jgi:hypothetical protein
MDKQLKEENLKLMRENIELRADIRKQFTPEELKALHSIIEYASKDLTIEDEPLLDILYEKTNIQKLITENGLVSSKDQIFNHPLSHH